MIAGVEVSAAWVLATLAGAGGVIAFLFRALITSKDREYSLLLKEKERDIKELENLWKSFRDISIDSVKVTTARENAFRAKENLPPLPIVVPVVPESFSPSTVIGRANADIATLRAKMEQIKISAGQDPMQFPEQGDEIR